MEEYIGVVLVSTFVGVMFLMALVLNEEEPKPVARKSRARKRIDPKVMEKVKRKFKERFKED